MSKSRATIRARDGHDMIVVRVRVASKQHQNMATERKEVGCGEKFRSKTRSRDLIY